MKNRLYKIINVTIILILTLTTAVNAASTRKIGDKMSIFGILGDANGDKKITSADAKVILENLSGQKKLNIFQKKRADVNQDGKITSADSLLILNYINSNNNSSSSSSNNSETAKSIQISGAKVINKGDNTTLKATVTPSNAINKNIKWSSSNVSKAIVNSVGKVTGRSKGNVTITAQTGNVKATYNMEVKDLNDGKLSNNEGVSVNALTECPSTMVENNNYFITKFSYGSNIDNINMSKNSNYKSTGAIALYYAGRILGANLWSDDVLNVFQNGYDTYWEKGNYKLIDYSNYEEQIKAIYSEVIKGNPVIMAVNNENGESQYILAYGIYKNSKSITADEIAIMDPKTGTWGNLDKYYQYKSDNKNVYRCAILDTDAPAYVSLNNNSVSIEKGNSTTLEARPVNKGGIEAYIQKVRQLRWSSSNTYVADVNQYGYIEANNVGTATITVETINGKTDSCEVTVKEDAYSYNFNGSKYKIAVTKSKLNSVIDTIQNKEIYQKKMGGNCYRISIYHTYLLLDYKDESSASKEQANKDITPSYTIDTKDPSTFIQSVKKEIDNRNPVVIHVSSSVAQHWVTAVGYKGEEDNLGDLLILGSYSGGLLNGGNGETCKGLRLYSKTNKYRGNIY